MTLKFTCIVGSTREGRMGDRVLKLFKNQFKIHFSAKDYQLQVIDPSDYDLPIVKKPLHFHSDWSTAPEDLHKLNNIVSSSDAFFVITPEYNATLPPGLTNIVDHIPPASFSYKPSGIIGYTMGNRGAAFAIVAARPFLSEIGCLPVKSMTMISSVQKDIDEEGNTQNHHIISSITKLMNEVEWWADASKTKRDKDGLPK